MIYTVNGPISKTDFGNACIHEHICVASNDMKHTFGKEWFDKESLVELAVDVLKNAGFGLFVDGTPCDLGRDVTILKKVSELSGVNIVASTGFYYFPDLFSVNRTSEDLAEWIFRECTEGMEGTGIKPGILKCASNGEQITEDSKKRLRAMAMVQKKTGLPMYVHCSHSGEVSEKIDLLAEAGAVYEKLVIGHCGLKPDVEYLEEFLKKGCYIAMDQNHCSPRKEEVANALTELCKRGYSKQICLSSDHCIYSDFTTEGNTGIEKNADFHIQMLNYQMEKIRACFEGSEDDFRKMTGENIADILDV